MLPWPYVGYFTKLLPSPFEVFVCSYFMFLDNVKFFIGKWVVSEVKPMKI